MTNYNENMVDMGGAKLLVSENLSVKRSFHSIKKEFEQYMMDGCKQSFSVIDGNEAGSDSDPLTEDRTIRFLIGEAVEYKKNPVSEQTFSNYIPGIVGGAEKQQGQTSNLNTKDAVMKQEFGAIKPGLNLVEEGDGAALREPREKTGLDYLNELNNRADNNVRILLSDGEYILKIIGDHSSLTSSDIHKYLEFIKKDYDFKITRAYLNNRLVYEQPGDSTESQQHGGDGHSYLNLYF